MDNETRRRLLYLQDLITAGGTVMEDDPPQAVGTAAAGVAAEASRGDHVHAHGNQLGGALHADAGAVAGFMTAAQVTRLAGVAPAVLLFGSFGVANNTTVQYLRAGGAHVAPAGTVRNMRVPFACVARNFYVQAATAGGSDASIVIYKNGVAAVTFTLLSGATQAAETVSTITLAAGDQLGCSLQNAAAAGTADNVVVSFQATQA